jgi:hypothetical protein
MGNFLSNINRLDYVTEINVFSVNFKLNFNKIIIIIITTKVIPVIIGATGTISKSFRKYVNNITGNHEVKELQKTAILGTAHILRKVLM